MKKNVHIKLTNNKTHRTKTKRYTSYSLDSFIAAYCHPAYLIFFAMYIMQNAGLNESKARIKIARRNINNLRNADDTTLMAESELELKNFLMRVKEESEKAGLKVNIKKKLRSWHLVPSLHGK